MHMYKRTVVSALFMAVVVIAEASAEDKTIKEVTLEGRATPADIAFDRRQNSFMPVRTIVDAMNIKPGMTIIDIGAGTGRIAFAMADAMKGSGTVYATERDPFLVDYMKKKAAAEGYENLIPVLVGPGAGGDFYKERTFDIIVASQILQFIWSPKDFFGGLRQSLSMENGRLFVVEHEAFFHFHELDFSDFKLTVDDLAREGADFPVNKLMSAPVRDFISRYEGEDVPGEVRSAIVSDLNGMLSRRSLYNDLTDYYVSKRKDDKRQFLPSLLLTSKIDPTEALLAMFLAQCLDENGVFDGEEKALSGTERAFLEKLNKIILASLVRTDPVIYKFRHSSPPVFCIGKKSVVLKLEAAGYELVADHDVLPRSYFLEFKRKD